VDGGGEARGEMQLIVSAVEVVDDMVIILNGMILDLDMDVDMDKVTDTDTDTDKDMEAWVIIDVLEGEGTDGDQHRRSRLKNTIIKGI
jgi:hypothetical protein